MLKQKVFHQNQPRPLEWFWLNLKVGSLSLGGAARTLLYQDAVVHEKKWLSETEFHHFFTASQVFPGPNLVNLSVYLGYRLVGFWGGLWGLLALGLPGALGVIFLAHLVELNDPDVRLIFQGFAIGSVGLFLVFIVRLLSSLLRHHRTRRKIAIRLVFILIVAGLALSGLSLSGLLLVGGAAAWGIERWT